MRHYPDTAVIVGGRTSYIDVPCYFTMMDVVKTEALYGAAQSVGKGVKYLPLFVNIPESGRDLSMYSVVLVSPHHPLIDTSMDIESVRWMRVHQVLTLSFPAVTSSAI